MLDPVQLFAFEDHVDQRTVRADTLVVTLGSFSDAGSAQRIINTHLVDSLPSHLLGHFDTDQLLDYRAQRPLIDFDHDHFHSYQRPEIRLHRIEDEQGRSFLLLSGPEPSLQWERMAAAVDYLIDKFDITQTYVLSAVPSPTPHTRAPYVAHYAGDPATLVKSQPVPGNFRFSASFTALLAIRLHEAGRAITGLSAHIPHYVAEAEYPQAALALLTDLGEISGLSVPTRELAVASGIVKAQLGVQFEQDEDAMAKLHGLEQQYDAWINQAALPSPEDLPDADELGAEIEDYLRTLEQ